MVYIPVGIFMVSIPVASQSLHLLIKLHQKQSNYLWNITGTEGNADYVASGSRTGAESGHIDVELCNITIWLVHSMQKS